MYPTDRQYTTDHEWISVSGKTARIGITDYAQDQLGDVVFVELPDVGQVFEASGGRRVKKSGRPSVGLRWALADVQRVWPPEHLLRPLPAL